MVKPNYQILINNSDATDKLSDKLISINVTDNANNESDELELNISGNFERPKYQDEIKLYIGYDNDLNFIGLFKVQSTNKTFTQLSVRATSVDFSDSFKVKRNITYENVSIKQIANQIANKHSLNIKSDYDDLFIVSQAQANESDMSFLNRLAKEYNAIFNVKNDTLYFMKKVKDGVKSDELPKYNINVDECHDISIQYSNSSLYNSCEVSWHDTKENKTFKVIYPKNGGEPVLKFKNSFKSEAQAIERAKAQLQRANQGLVTGTLRKEGEIIFAGGVIVLENHIDLDITEYQTTKIMHNINKQSGWTTTIDFEN